MGGEEVPEGLPIVFCDISSPVPGMRLLAARCSCYHQFSPFHFQISDPLKSAQPVRCTIHFLMPVP